VPGVPQEGPLGLVEPLLADDVSMGSSFLMLKTALGALSLPRCGRGPSRAQLEGWGAGDVLDL
jgi:hypothetical protein